MIPPLIEYAVALAAELVRYRPKRCYTSVDTELTALWKNYITFSIKFNFINNITAKNNNPLNKT